MLPNHILLEAGPRAVGKTEGLFGAHSVGTMLTMEALRQLNARRSHAVAEKALSVAVPQGWARN
jgi:hypothetical protein